jgi:hypothetical protein
MTRGQPPTATVPYGVSGIYPAINVATALGTVGTPGAANTAGTNFTVSNYQLGGNTANKLVLDMQNNASSEGYTVTYTFTRQSNGQPYSVFNLNFTMFDCDSQTGPDFIDNIYLTWTGTATMGATLGAYVQGSGITGAPWTGDKGGDHNAGQTDPSGNIVVTFTGGVSQLVIHYLSGTIFGSEQFIGISNLTWCR